MIAFVDKMRDRFGVELVCRVMRQAEVGFLTARGYRAATAFRNADDLELATLSWVHWFNENRLHSSIGYLTPIEKRNKYYREMNPQHQPALGELALH